MSTGEATLDDVARQLEELAKTIKALQQSGKLEASQLAEAVRSLQKAIGAPPQEEERAARKELREAVLQALERRSPLLPIELAAVTLSLPEEIQPVLEELEEEGVITIHTGPRGKWVTLASRPSRFARR